MARNPKPTLKNEHLLLALMTIQTFEPLVGSNFTVTEGGDGITGAGLVLTSATAGQSAYPSIGRASFSLLFTGPLEPALSQLIYTLSHDRLGELSLFLVPVGLDDRGRLYEAVFN
jgi:hypothetical protein